MRANTTTPEPWPAVAFRAGVHADGMRELVRLWCVQWHTEHRRKLRPDMLEALQATAPLARVVADGVCGGNPDFSHRELAERAAEHIRRSEPVVLAMLMAEADAADPDTTVPLPLETIIWALPDCREAADRVERAAAAHDAATDELFNPRANR